jgi:outer membrane protein assembly factor BamD (BamD/ComL family)
VARAVASPPVPPRPPVPARSLVKPARSGTAPRSKPLAEPASQAQTSAQPPLLAEVNLLKQARTALRSGDATLALELLDRYSGELHGTDLNAEAMLLRVETLAALHRENDAAQLAERFVAENPDSPLVDRARSFLKAHGTLPNAQAH